MCSNFMVLRRMDINGLYIITIHVNNLVVSYILGLYSYYIFTFLYLLYVFNKLNALQSVFSWEGGGVLSKEIARIIRSSVNGIFFTTDMVK